MAQTLLVAAGAPDEITNSVESLAEVVQEVAVQMKLLRFITANWKEAPEDGPAQELPPLSEFIGTFEDGAVHENEKFQDLGFDHNENGSFRAQHGMMQFISADTNAVNELANAGDVASAMALAASNMFVNAGQDNFVEGTYCADNPGDPECAAGHTPEQTSISTMFLLKIWYREWDLNIHLQQVILNQVIVTNRLGYRMFKWSTVCRRCF